MLACRSFAAPARQCLRGARHQPWLPALRQVKSLPLRPVELAVLTRDQHQLRGFAEVADEDKVAKFKGQKGNDVGNA